MLESNKSTNEARSSFDHLNEDKMHRLLKLWCSNFMFILRSFMRNDTCMYSQVNCESKKEKSLQFFEKCRI